MPELIVQDFINRQKDKEELRLLDKGKTRTLDEKRISFLRKEQEIQSKKFLEKVKGAIGNFVHLIICLEDSKDYLQQQGIWPENLDGEIVQLKEFIKAQIQIYINATQDNRVLMLEAKGNMSVGGYLSLDLDQDMEVIEDSAVNLTEINQILTSIEQHPIKEKAEGIFTSGIRNFETRLQNDVDGKPILAKFTTYGKGNPHYDGTFLDNDLSLGEIITTATRFETAVGNFFGIKRVQAFDHTWDAFSRFMKAVKSFKPRPAEVAAEADDAAYQTKLANHTLYSANKDKYDNLLMFGTIATKRLEFWVTCQEAKHVRATPPETSQQKAGKSFFTACLLPSQLIPFRDMIWQDMVFKNPLFATDDTNAKNKILDEAINKLQAQHPEAFLHFYSEITLEDYNDWGASYRAWTGIVELDAIHNLMREYISERYSYDDGVRSEKALELHRLLRAFNTTRPGFSPFFADTIKPLIEKLETECLFLQNIKPNLPQDVIPTKLLDANNRIDPVIIPGGFSTITSAFSEETKAKFKSDFLENMKQFKIDATEANVVAFCDDLYARNINFFQCYKSEINKLDFKQWAEHYLPFRHSSPALDELNKKVREYEEMVHSPKLDERLEKAKEISNLISYCQDDTHKFYSAKNKIPTEFMAALSQKFTKEIDFIKDVQSKQVLIKNDAKFHLLPTEVVEPKTQVLLSRIERAKNWVKNHWKAMLVGTLFAGALVGTAILTGGLSLIPSAVVAVAAGMDIAVLIGGGVVLSGGVTSGISSFLKVKARHDVNSHMAEVSESVQSTPTVSPSSTPRGSSFGRMSNSGLQPSGVPSESVSLSGDQDDVPMPRARASDSAELRPEPGAFDAPDQFMSNNL